MSKILLPILNMKGSSGAVNYVKETVPIIKERYAVETEILTSRTDNDYYPFRIIKMPLIKNFRGYWKRLLFSAFAKIISKKYDIINGHGELLKQDILTLHNLIHLSYEKLNRKKDGLWFFHQKMLSSKDSFKIIIANSAFMKKDLIERFGIKEENIKIVYPSYNPIAAKELPDKKEAKIFFGLNPDKFCFLLPASGDFEKRGVRRFIRILSQVNLRHKNIQALITGKDANIEEYMRLLKDLGLGNIVKIIPPTKNIPNLYACADCVIYPAVLEEFGIALTEAMAAGIPVICSEHIGAVELMTEEAADFSICKNEEEFAAKAEEILQDKIKKDIFIKNSQKIKQRTWEKTSEEIYLVYKNFI
ncbi:MAG: glycosyltransferase family 4 protein [Elusimicrobiota bacterium]